VAPAFFTLVLDGDDCLSSHPRYMKPWERAHSIQWTGDRVGPHFGEEINLLPLPGFKPQNVW